MIAGTIPIDLLAREQKQIYDRGAEVGRADVVSEAHHQTLQTWHERWRTVTKGRWTYLLIHDIMKWLGREYGAVNFYLTQFLTGHACFRYYLFKLGRHERDDAEHTFFACSRWTAERQRLEVMVERLSPKVVNACFRGKTDGMR